MGNLRKKKVNLEDVLADQAPEDIIEVPVADRIFKVFFAAFFLFSLVIAIQLIDLGVRRHNFYAARAVDNMSDVKVEPAPRGIIFDRTGLPLIKNEPSYKAYLLPRNLPETSEARLAEINRIFEILGLDEGLRKKLRERDWSLTEKFLLVADLNQEQLVNIVSANLKSVKIEPSFKRMPTKSFVFSHLLGFTGLVGEEDLQVNRQLSIDDEIGKDGLEGFYDSYLRGINGEEVTVRDAVGFPRGEQKRRLAEPGKNMRTFIDAGLQEYFYERLKKGLDTLGRTRGAGIAIDPRNGEVLALISFPGFDSTNISKFLNSQDKPLFNRAISGLYTPGSTIKPLHAVAALAEGVVDPKTEIFSAGFIELPNPYFPEIPSRFLDWRAHGWVNLRSAIARSSNVYFYEVGGGFGNQIGLGINRLKKWWQEFRLDSVTGIDLPGEAKGFLPDPDWKERKTGEPWRIGDTYNVSIGQGDLLITPLGLLNYISAVANGGKLYRPRVVESIIDASGQIVYYNKPEILGEITPAAKGFLREVQEGMRDAVRMPYGTANILNDLPISVAAKTGTSQVENNKRTNAFFVGYAPFEAPEIAILILIEDSREGSLNTVPIAKDVLMWYYKNRLK
jgi:penicillin-binding protein 2